MTILHPGVHAVKQILKRMWNEEDGVLSFEWTMLTSLLTVGVVSGVAAVRDATIDEMGDLSQAMLSLDQSYMIQPPLAVQVHTGGFGSFGGGFASTSFGGFGGVSAASGSQFVDAMAYDDCYRVNMKVQEFPRRVPGAPVEPPPVPAEPPAL
jgi:Flp pilus assembly pilin Flp